MRKHPFVLFLLTIAVLITGAISFIQSESFARVLKGFVARHLPSDLGIQGDFSDLSVGLFPPSVSIRNPNVALGQHNLINLPPGSSVTAKRIDLRFRLFQMFTGNIRINEVAVVDGDVKLVLQTTPEQKKSTSKPRTKVNWDELFQIRAEAVGLENTAVHLQFAGSSLTADLTAEQLRLAQWSGPGGLGYELRADLKNLNCSVLKDWIPEEGISRLSAIAHVNAQGLVVDDLATFLQGVDVHLAGQVKGNVLTDRELPFDSKVTLKADLNSISQFLSRKANIQGEGDVEMNLRARGNLLDVEHTAKFEGQVVGQNVRYGNYFAEQVAAEGGYTLYPQRELTITHALITSRETPRVGGHHAASGGKLEIGNVKYVLGSSDRVVIPLKLERAHLQWLGAGALKDVYPLDSRLTGSVTATIQKSQKGWSADADLNLSTDVFQLDNQRLGQEKPMRRVLRIPDLKLIGPAHVDSAGLKVQNVALTLPHSKLTVNGTVGKNGFDLLGEGPVNLADLVEISEVPISGEGNLSIHTHGPSSRVLIDFDGDIKNARYLRLHFGDFSGRITWDDDPQILVFDHVKALKGQSNYLVNGKLDLGKVETAGIDVVFQSANIYDVSQIFDEFTHDFWWFPHTLAGPVTGTAKVGGGLKMSELVVSAEMTGHNWEYLGERSHFVYVKGGYDKGKYQITDIHGTKQTGKFVGRISYDPEGRFDWFLKTQDFQAVDLDHLARLDVPFRGNLGVETHGTGKGPSIQSYTTATVSNLSVRGLNYESSELQLKTENGVASGSARLFGNQGFAEFSYGLTPKASSFLRLDANSLDFSPTVLLLNSKLMQDPSLRAIFSGNVNLRFLSGEVERSSGSVSVLSYDLEKTGTGFKLVSPVSIKINDGDFALRNLALAGPTGTVALNLEGHPSALNGSVSGDLDLGIAEFLVSTVSKAQGTASLDFSIGGILKAPKVYGAAEFDEGTLRIPAIDSPFENIDGTVQLRQNVLTVQNLEADLGGGRIRLGGNITLFPDHYPTVALHSDLSGNRIRVYPFQFVKVRGNLGINGNDRPYLVDGSLTVDSALSKEKMLGAKQGEGLKSLQYTPPSTAQGSAEIPLVKLKIDVSADHGILVQNDLFDAEMKGDVTVVNTLEAPRIIGKAEMIQGKMKFKDRNFQVQSANLTFDNPNIINPQFNLAATTEISNTKIQIYASGRASKPKVDLTSNPAMSESEILSLLTMGNLPTDASKRIANFATDRSAVQQGEAASLLLESLDFNRELQEKTGFEFQLDEYENTLQGQSIFTKSANETTVAPRIIVRRRLGDRVTLSYGSTVGVDVNKQTEANAEFHVTPGFSVLGVWDTYEFSDLQQKRDSQSSYGFDLRLQKRFK